MNTFKKVAALIALTVAGLGLVAPSAQAAGSTAKTAVVVPASSVGAGQMSHLNSWDWN